MSDRLKTFIRQRAAELGFDVCRFASAADAWPAGERLRRFVDEGRHGDMEWMETTLDRRQHPTAMWDEARTAIVLGMNYGPDDNPLDQLADRVVSAKAVPRLAELGRARLLDPADL
mgnify:CR=1 FL=1